MKIKVSEATGPVLDWLVAKCEGFLMVLTYKQPRVYVRKNYSFEDDLLWTPSTNWSQGGPIMERAQIDTFYDGNYVVARKAHMVKHPTHDMMSYCAMRGHTTLIASMRCYVASKLGDEVDIPSGIGE